MISSFIFIRLLCIKDYILENLEIEDPVGELTAILINIKEDLMDPWSSDVKEVVKILGGMATNITTMRRS